MHTSSPSELETRRNIEFLLQELREIKGEIRGMQERYSSKTKPLEDHARGILHAQLRIEERFRKWEDSFQDLKLLLWILGGLICVLLAPSARIAWREGGGW